MYHSISFHCYDYLLQNIIWSDEVIISDFSPNQNYMKALIYPVLYHWFRLLWCNEAEEIFLIHFGCTGKWASLNAKVYLSRIYLCPSLYDLVKASSSRIMNHATELKTSRTGFLNMSMSPTAPRSQCSIEHLWDVLDWEICIMDVQPSNL